MMKISVSIVTYHTSTDELERCLQSLQSPVVERIYIIDNGEEERLRRFCDGRPKVTYMQAPNPGFGAAHNMALLHTTAPLHLVLNADVRFDPAVLERLADVMERYPQAAQIQPRVLNADGSLQYASRRTPSPWILIGRRFLPDRWMAGANRRYLLQDQDLTKALNVPYQTGCFMLLRSEAAQAIGGFDERFFMYPEDIDLSRRLHERHMVIYWPEEEIVHDHAADSYRSLRMLRIHAVNMLRYFRKWGFFDSERRRINAAIEPIK